MPGIFIANGLASWYGPGFQGKPTSSGTNFDMNNYTAAHKYLEFGTLVRVTNLKNGRDVIVEINDRGPVSKNRIIDLSKSAAAEIDIIKSGIARVELEIIGYKEIEMQTLLKHYNNILIIKKKH